MNKLILIMIDGISAELFEHKKAWMPHMHALAQQGTQVQALTPEVCGTSFPGRTSIIVGRPAAEHGIYGNKIWDGGEFRWSTPDDVRTPSLAYFAQAAGKDVAAIGYGMVRPEDCDVFLPPWWQDEVVNRARNEPPTSESGLSTQANSTPFANNMASQQRIAALAAANIQTQVIHPNTDARANPDGSEKLSLGMLADQQLLEIAAGLANSAQAPDLILLEIGVTDYYLHSYGKDHPLTEWSLRTADAQIGSLLERLRQGGRLQDYNVAIMSDHGHAPMNDALYCDQLLPEGTRWSSEGGMLLIAPRSAEEAQQVTAILQGIGIEAWPNDFLPEDQREHILVFTSPEGSQLSFERDLNNTGHITGASKYLSNHGMRPGNPADYRFCLFTGPQVPQSQVPFGLAKQVAPTLAALMGITTDWEAAPLFQPV